MLGADHLTFEEEGMDDFRKKKYPADFEWKKILQGNIWLCIPGKKILSPEVWKKSIFYTNQIANTSPSPLKSQMVGPLAMEL